MLVTKMAKTATNILKLSPTHFVSNIEVTQSLEHEGSRDQFFEESLGNFRFPNVAFQYVTY